MTGQHSSHCAPPQASRVLCEAVNASVSQGVLGARCCADLAFMFRTWLVNHPPQTVLTYALFLVPAKEHMTLIHNLMQLRGVSACGLHSGSAAIQSKLDKASRLRQRQTAFNMFVLHLERSHWPCHAQLATVGALVDELQSYLHEVCAVTVELGLAAEARDLLRGFSFGAVFVPFVFPGWSSFSSQAELHVPHRPGGPDEALVHALGNMLGPARSRDCPFSEIHI